MNSNPLMMGKKISYLLERKAGCGPSSLPPQQWRLGSEHHVMISDHSKFFHIFQPKGNPVWILKHIHKKAVILFKEKNRKVQLSSLIQWKSLRKPAPKSELVAFICWFELCTQHSRRQFSLCSPQGFLMNILILTTITSCVLALIDYLLLEFKGCYMPQ